MRNEDSDFSLLKTVTSFDAGDSQTLAVDVKPQDLQHLSPASLLIESLIEQICSLMEKDASNQRNLYLDVCRKLHHMNLIDESFEREEFQFMRSHYKKAFYHFLSVARSTTSDDRTLVPKINRSLPFNNEGIAIELSRYRTEFQELGYIAKGGFGQVYKARHNLDREIYAIKKIFLRYRSVKDFLQNVREVKMLAKLNHPNIVSYKAAWLEASDECTPKAAIANSSVDDSSPKSTTKQTDDSLEVVFEGSVESSYAHKERQGLDRSEVFQRDDFSDDSSESEFSSDQICRQESGQNYQFRLSSDFVRQTAVLFIQMQLCHKTLRQWLDVRNLETSTGDPTETMKIFRQIVRGVEYIHSQGIVHHDIKPSNIFVSHDLRLVQVGDFGLACCLLTHSQPSLSVVSTHQPGQLGTKLYAAPEQLRGLCHAKSDVYSLGIVLFELIQPFNTAMERSKVIGQLRDGQIPSELIANHNSIAQIISQTVTSLKKRPSSSELLEYLNRALGRQNDKIVEEQNRTIHELRQESIAKDEEIAELKRQLEDLSKRLN